jgi:ribose transport system permease protein
VGGRLSLPRVRRLSLRIREQLTSAPAVYATTVVLFLVIAVKLPGIVTKNGVLSLLVLASVLGIASIGQTLTIMLGGIDLSIPAVMGMADVLLAYLYSNGWNFGVIVAIVVGVSIIIGALNGLISSMFGLHPLVVTFATGSIVIGGVLKVTKGTPGGNVPTYITEAVSPSGRTGPIPLPAAMLLWILLSAITLLLVHRSVLGRRLYGLGANPIAAPLALIRPPAMRAVIYAISAVCAGAAGLLLGGFSGGASVEVGNPYLFSTVTAVVVGGTSLLGGRGGYGRTIAGVLMTTEITTLLVGLGVGASMQETLLGVVILILLLVYGREARLADLI